MLVSIESEKRDFEIRHFEGLHAKDFHLDMSKLSFEFWAAVFCFGGFF